MSAKRWNYKKNEYESYDLPDGASFFEDDMNKEISCCQCGKKIKFGDSYTSRTIHTEGGFGYAECEDCYYFDLMKGE